MPVAPQVRFRRAVFLDRDGTVARYREYCCTPEDFELLPGIGEAIRRLKQSGFLVIVVTNQSAIGRGWLTHERLAMIHEKMRAELKRHGASVDAVYVCPHRPEERCACRKPSGEMLLRASRELGVSLADSYLVGDRLQDVRAGRQAGCTTILVRSGHPPERCDDVRPDHESANLCEAVTWISQREKTDWSGSYVQLFEMMGRVYRQCPRLPVLCISILHPRHAPPPDQIRLLRELDAQTGPRRRPPSLIGLMIRWLRCVLFAVRATLGIGALKVCFRSTLKHLMREPARVILRTWCFGPPSPETADDFYYGTLPQQLEARGLSSVLLCGDTRERFDGAFAHAVLRHPTIRRVPEQLLMPVWAPLVIVWQQLTAALVLRRLALQADTDRFAAVCAAACEGSVQRLTLCNTLQFSIARSAVKAWRASAFVTFYEGQAWEHAAWHGAKAADPTCVVVGYQHTVLKPFSRAVVSPERIPWEPAVPEVVLCLGEVTRSMMVKGHEPFGNRLVLFGTCRRTMENTGPVRPRPDRRTVLVIPEGILTEAQLLFDFATQAAEGLRDHQFIFRCHPVLPFDEIRPRLQTVPERLTNIEISQTNSFAEDCDRSSVALYRGSSAVLYAVLRGLKPLYVRDDRFPDADPLFALTPWRQTVASAGDLRERLQRYALTPEEEAAEEWRLGVGYVNAYAGPVTDASLDRFLDAVGLRRHEGRRG